MTVRKRFLTALSCLVLAACTTDNPGPLDSGTPDAGLPEGQLALPGLDGRVEAIIDDRGMPHIYATTRHDLMVVQGYLMCRDRFGQMEFIRRSVLGRLAEVAGPDSLGADLEARQSSYARMGREIYAGLAVDDPTRLTAEAFVEGINLYIDRVNTREEDPAVPGAEVVNLILSSPFFGHWEASDIFALARFQSANLSYDPENDLRNSQRLAGVLAAFPVDSADPRLAARAGLFGDLFTDRPARIAFTRAGFNDGTTSALLPGVPAIRRPRQPMYVPSLASIEGALPYLDRYRERRESIFGDDTSRGSNQWVVAGEHTMSGNPILANDPHLSLISPPVWWYVHLNTAREGGEDMIDAEGVAFAGLPGVVLGFNRDIAWGATTTGYDVTDDYEEQLTGTCDTDGNVTGGTVLFNGAQVPVEFFDEVLHVSGETDSAGMTIRLPHVAHHGPFLPGSCAPIAGMPGRFTAITVRYTGFEASNELAFFTDLLTATNVEEARLAQDAFRVGSQNIVVIDRDDIQWSTESRIPVRDPRAVTLAYPDGTDPADGIPSGHCPNMVVPGTGEYEWTGDLPDTAIPHDINPASGWIATANQDNVGVTLDGNPCNDAHYIGSGFDFGWREFRIQERLAELVDRGDITTEDMVALHGETQFQPGRAMAPAIAAILESPATAVPTLTPAEVTRLEDARARLMAWTFESPHGVGATAATEIADSVAMTIFTVAMTRIIPLAFEDEVAAIGNGGGSSEQIRLLEWMLTDPSSLYTYDAAITESVLWDDIRTDAVETKAEIVIRGVLAALVYLEGRLGADVSMWRWGRLHTVRFGSIIPSLGVDILSIPAEDDETYPDGFPRHGGFNTVDPGNHGVWNTTNFSHGSGASQRLVLEMTPTGPRAFNALPGGQLLDPTSVHHDDEAAHWIANEQPPLYFDEADINAHEERRLTFVTAN